MSLSAGSGAALYYTIDGTTPTISSRLYSGPITIAGSGTGCTDADHVTTSSSVAIVSRVPAGSIDLAFNDSSNGNRASVESWAHGLSGFGGFVSSAGFTTDPVNSLSMAADSSGDFWLTFIDTTATTPGLSEYYGTSWANIPAGLNVSDYLGASNPIVKIGSNGTVSICFAIAGSIYVLSIPKKRSFCNGRRADADVLAHGR